MKTTIIYFIFFFSFSAAMAQSEEEGITAKIDALTEKWDKEAEILKTYQGMKEYCRSQPHRASTIKLVGEIHHYDSLLYKVVQSKFDENKDSEAKETLKDIKKLEDEYTTKSFLNFLHKECGVFHTIEQNFGGRRGKVYDKEVAKLEKELVSYVEEITQQIDIIDEHIHHLNNL